MENKDSFYQVFEASPVPTIILTGTFPDILVKEANRAYISLTGRSRNEIIGAHFAITKPHPGMHLDKVGLLSVRQSIEKVYREKRLVKTPVQKFLRPAHTGGFEILFFEATNTPVLDTNGEIDFIVRTLQNVTDLAISLGPADIEKVLSKNEHFLNETQKIARIGGWEMDSDFRFYWSDIHYEMMEVEPGTEITVDFGISLLKEQKDRDLFRDVFQKAVTNGDYFDIELNIITPKGNERWIRFSGKGELIDGVFTRLYGTGQDITGKKQTQQELIDSRNRFEKLIQTVDGIVFESDAQTFELNFISGQVESLLGYTPEECIAQPHLIDKIFQPADKERLLKLAGRQIAAIDNHTGDYRLIRKDGGVVWMKISVSVINENGSPKWLRGLIIDITASKRISELEHVEKEVLELNAKPSEPLSNILNTYLKGIEAIFSDMRCSIMQIKGDCLYNWSASSLPPSYTTAIDELPIKDNAGSCGTAAFRKEKVIVSDISTDPRWTNYKEIALQHNLLACWSQPVKDVNGEVIATLGMYYNIIKTPTEEEIKTIDRAVNLLQVILQSRKNLELLEEANFLMKQSQEMAGFGSVQHDLKTGELTWSSELYNIFGIDRRIKPTIDLYYDFIHPDDRDFVMQQINNFLITKKDYVSEERIIRSDGEVRDLKTWGRVKTDEKGETVKIIAAYMDITDSKKIQEELLASETRLRNLVDSQTNYVIRIDFNDNYTYTNKKYIEDFKPATTKSLIGTPTLASVLSDYQESAIKTARKCIEHPNEVFEVELEKYGNDGLVKYTFWHFICLTNSKNEPIEIQGIGLDVSDRQKAENERERQALELYQSEKRYSDLFHLSPQPMWVYDVETLQFVDINNAAIKQYGYSREEFLSMLLTDILPQQQHPEFIETIKKASHENNFFEGIYSHILKSGELIQVDIKRNRILFKGKTSHLVLAINITDRLQYLAALENQNKRLGEIAWMQSHVVRAPLSRIMGLIEVLDYSNDENERSMMLQNIVSSAYELDEVIREIVRKAEQTKLGIKEIKK